MDEQQAQKIADALQGKVWDSGGGIHLVVINRQDGKLVVISDEVVCEYASEEDFENSLVANSILLH
jgi:hypothetical protein